MFTKQNLQINRGSTSANSQGGSSVTVTHTYKDLNQTVANIILSFPDYLGEGAEQDIFFVGDHMLIEGSDTTTYNKILTLAPFTVGTDLFSGASGLSVGAPIVAADANALKITAATLQAEIADATHPGIVTTAAQSFGGVKDFSAKKIGLGSANTYFDNTVTNAQEIMWHFAGTSPTDDFVYYDTGTRAFSFAINSSDVFTSTATAFYVFPPLILSDGVDSDVAIPLLIGDNNATAIALNAPATVINSATVDFVAASVTNFMQGNTTIQIGTNAADSITSATECIGIGTNALTAVTTGASCIGIGTQAGASNVTGQGCVAVGSEALSLNLEGEMTAFGYLALRVNTTGSNGAAFGSRALASNTTGGENTGLGRGALELNTVGFSNTGVGESAININTTGDENTAIGVETLVAMDGGNRNSAFGVNTLNGITTGSNNLALGYNAGSALTVNNNANIDIAHAGVAGDVGIVRMGTAGTHVKNFQAGIRGITTDAADAIAVLISSTGQLGTVSSLRSQKENITAISAKENSEIIKKLNPVRFDYIGSRGRNQQFGLIAEEVADVCEDICAYEMVDGKEVLKTVYYDRLPIMLLREVQRLQTEIELLKAK
jgi:hypothetical protein